MCLRTVTKILAFFLVCCTIALSSGCGNGDNGSQEAVLARNTTLQGNVAQVLAALQPQPAQPSYWARWHEFFHLVPVAHAQATNLGGILVLANQGNTTVATTTTDANGSFILRVAAGTVTLVFTTATYTVSTTLTVPANTTVLLVVNLEPTRVDVPTQVVLAEGTLSAIRCTGGSVQLPAVGPEQDLVINGGGEDCVRAEGQCTINLVGGRDLTLDNCAQCIRAAGNADVSLTTGRDLRCTAVEDGIRAEGTASVRLNAASLTVVAGEHGIRAAGNADVSLPTDKPCSITGTEAPARIDGNATITGCNVPTQVIPDAGTLGPIRCTGGSVQLPAVGAEQDLVIDGGGEDCVRAEGQCTINLVGGRDLTLDNCAQCIRAAGNADVSLTTGRDLRCTAVEDGIRAEGTASVTLNAASLTVVAGEHGIRAAGNADVSLPTDKPCSITGTEATARIDGNATITGCNVPTQVIPDAGTLGP